MPAKETDNRLTISLKGASRLASVSKDTMRRMLDSGAVQDLYIGHRRLVVLASLGAALRAKGAR